MEKTTFEATENDFESVERRLWNVAHATEDGHVRGHLTGCTETDAGEIIVHVRLPNDETHLETFDFPKVDSRDYRFVRLVESCGYSLSSAEYLVGDSAVDKAEVWCESVDTEPHSEEDDWRIVVPEYTPPLRDRCRERLAVLDSRQVVTTLMVAGGVLVLPLLVPIMLFWLTADDEFNDALILLAFLPVLLLFWGLALLILYGAFSPVFELLFGVDLPRMAVLF
jgi:hypothetical protein